MTGFRAGEIHGKDDKKLWTLMDADKANLVLRSPHWLWKNGVHYPYLSAFIRVEKIALIRAEVWALIRVEAVGA